jgi:hypothetical protein
MEPVFQRADVQSQKALEYWVARSRLVAPGDDSWCMNAGQRSVVPPCATAKPLRKEEAEDQFSRSQDEIPGF